MSMETKKTTQQLEHVQRAYSLVLGMNWFATILPGAVIIVLLRTRGLTLQEIGLGMGLYALVIGLLELPTGGLADSIGRKRITLIAYGLTIFAQLTLFMTTSLPLFLVYAVFSGSARALASGALEAWFINSLKNIDPDVNLQPWLARANTTELLALSLGTLIGALVPMAIQIVFNSENINAALGATILVSAVFHAITFFLVLYVITEQPDTQGRFYPALVAGLYNLPCAIQASIRTVQQDFILKSLLGLQFVTGFVLAGIETFWQPFFADDLRVGKQSTLILGVLFAGCFVAGILGNLSSTKLLRLLKGQTAALGLITQTLQAFALLLLALQETVWIAAFFLWLSYFARSVFASPFATLFNTRLAASQRSMMLSVLSVTFFFGFSGGNLIWGTLTNYTSISTVWTISSIVVLSSCWFLRSLKQ
jgi:MFS transporter, DHA1 family, quinolone resistance protein